MTHHANYGRKSDADGQKTLSSELERDSVQGKRRSRMDMSRLR